MSDEVFVIMGTAEVAEYLEDNTGKTWTSRKVAKYLERSRDKGFPEDGFPEPDLKLACGSIWLQGTIDKYLNNVG